MKHRVGIIGFGRVSGVHQKALALLPDVTLVAVCDRKEEKREGLDPGIHFYTDYEEMLDQENLDAVHICLPHYLHYEAALACAKRGIHVLCEKPDTMDHVQLAKMKQLDKQYGITLAVCLQNRLNPTFLELKKRVESGEYGRLLGLKGMAVWSRPESYYEESPWRGKMAEAGGGLMINQAIHTLDQMQLLGGRIREVRGQIMNLLPYRIEVEDSACAHITFENGARGIFFGTVAYVKNSSIELQAVCEAGSFTVKDYALWYAPKDDENEKQLLIRDKRMLGSQAYYGAGHCDRIRGFYETLDGGEQNIVTVDEEGTDILLIEAIRRSSLENRMIKWEEMEDDRE